MRKVLAAVFFLIIGIGLKAQVNFIPEPVYVQEQQGYFTLSSQSHIVLDDKDSTHREFALLFASGIEDITGFKLKAATTGRAGSSIRLSLYEVPVDELGNEGYSLEIARKEIYIKANKPNGWFYGMQTLFQLLPSYLSQTKFENKGYPIPCLKIKDYPRFEWRGLMLDVSRHFFSKEVIKSYINQMAKYKFNTFHFHLTDNQGWRIEIKSLPKLTSIGAWRVPRTGYWKGFEAPQPGEAATYGGFYSQDDIREIVKYAAERYVIVVPEIDVPGHSLALIASYPEFSCTKTPQQVLAGDPWNIKRTNVLCAGNDSTYTALDKVFEEIASLFPAEYIHIGGDEVTRTYWKKCKECQQRIAEAGLRNEEELQAYFIKRVAKIVESKGKKVMGWYENLEGGLAPEMAVMSWKNMEGGSDASQKGHKVVMTPAFHTYLDFYQGDPVNENGPFSICRLSSSYNFDPVPAKAKAENIIGGQGSLWTEQVPNERKLQYMTWPRALALSEVFWTPQAKRSWDGFVPRMEAHLVRLDSSRIKYSRGAYEPIITGVRSENGMLKVNIDSEIKDLDVYYSFDDTSPDNFYPKYRGEPILIPRGTHHIRVVSYRNGKPACKEINLPLTELAKRLSH